MEAETETVAMYETRLRQTIIFKGPVPVDRFDVRPHFGGSVMQMRYEPDPDQQQREGEFHRKLLEHSANQILEWAKLNGGILTRGPQDLNLGPLGIIKGVTRIISVDFRRDLEIEVEQVLRWPA